MDQKMISLRLILIQQREYKPTDVKKCFCFIRIQLIFIDTGFAFSGTEKDKALMNARLGKTNAP